MSAWTQGRLWQDLEDAFGRASEVPRLLDRVAAARGPALMEAISELYEHTLHQGTIYSASPAVVWALIELAGKAKPPERAAFYSMLSDFAWSARKALADGIAIPCHSGGDPADGAGIREAILAAHLQFEADLAHPEPAIRAEAAALATAFPETLAETARLVRDRYFVEEDPRVRLRVVDGLIRAQARFGDWLQFLVAALDREDALDIRFRLRRAQVVASGPRTEQSCLAELLSAFVRIYGKGDFYLGGGDFFDAIHLLGPERELEAMLSVLDQVAGRGLMLHISERLLRLVFEDARTGWGQLAHSTRTPKMDYFGLTGAAPSVRAALTLAQRQTLNACADKMALWQFRTNLWDLFGLPDSPEGIRRFVALHSPAGA